MDWIVIRKEYESSEISLSDLANKHGLKYNTVKSRSKREVWKKDAPENAPENAKGAIKGASKKREPRNKAPANKKETELEVSPDLTEKQKLFCLYYVKSYNATMSAIKAGYAKESAHVQGHDNLKIPKVAQEIKRLKGRVMQDLYIDAMDVLEVYAKIAFSDITECVEFGQNDEYVYVEGQKVIGDYGEYLTRPVNFVTVKNHTEVDGSLISEVKQGKEGISIKFHDKMKALEVLTKYFDLLPDNHKRKIEEANLELSKRRVVATEAELELRKADNDLKSF